MNNNPLGTMLDNLFTNKKSDWILKLDNNEIQPVVIQLILAMNDNLRVQVRWLDKYVFSLPPRMYLSLAWSVLPKTPKRPFWKYIKKEKTEDEFKFIFDKIRKQYELSDNDFIAIRSRVLEQIRSDMPSWFSYYGVPKKYWKQYYINFNLLKEFGKNDRVVPQKGLEAWGM